jgi:hypothetical protein
MVKNAVFFCQNARLFPFYVNRFPDCYIKYLLAKAFLHIKN